MCTLCRSTRPSPSFAGLGEWGQPEVWGAPWEKGPGLEISPSIYVIPSCFSVVVRSWEIERERGKKHTVAIDINNMDRTWVGFSHQLPDILVSNPKTYISKNYNPKIYYIYRMGWIIQSVQPAHSASICAGDFWWWWRPRCLRRG